VNYASVGKRATEKRGKFAPRQSLISKNFIIFRFYSMFKERPSTFDVPAVDSSAMMVFSGPIESSFEDADDRCYKG